jgi:hypothetical protein
VAFATPLVHFEGFTGRVWFGSPSIAANPVLIGKASELSALVGVRFPVVGLALAGVLAAVLFALAVSRRRLGGVALVLIGLPLVAWNALQTGYQYANQGPWERPGPAVVSRLFNVSMLEDRPWVDASVPPDASVALLPYASVAPEIWWDVEFWNRRVDRVIAYRNPAFRPMGRDVFHAQLDTLFHDQMRIDPRTGAVQGMRRHRMTPWIAAAESETRFGLAGLRPGRRQGGVELLRVDVPYRADWLAQNVLDDGWTAGRQARFLLFTRSTRAERRTLTLRLTPNVDEPRIWAVRAGAFERKGIVAPGSTARVRVPVCVRPGSRPAAVKLRVPNRIRLPDGRSVGILVSGVDVSSEGTPCRPRRRQPS